MQWADRELSLMFRKLLSVLVDPDDGLPLGLVGDDGAGPLACASSARRRRTVS